MKSLILNADIVIQTYEKTGRSLNKTGKLFGVSSKSIKKILIKAGVSYDTKVHYYHNEKIFDELNAESLYWLGMLSTDGSLYKNKYSYTIKLELATKDKKHLEKFKNFLEAENPIKDYINKSIKNKNFTKKIYYSSKLVITSKYLFNKLIEYNVTPCKTFNYMISNQILNHPQLSHFLRGFFDGDGWVRYHSNNKKLDITDIRIGLCGASEAVPTIFKLLKQKLNLSEDSGTFDKIQNVYRFEFSAHHDVNKIINYLYQNATTYLDRKYEIAMQAKSIAENSNTLDIDKEKLTNLYIQNSSIKKVAKILNVMPNTIKVRLDKFNIEYKKAIQHKYNLDFFSEKNECESQFYWAGFIAGKSTIVVRSSNIYIRINDTDPQHLENFLSTSNTISFMNKTPTNYYFTIHSKIILSDLNIRFNINGSKCIGKNANYTIPDWIIVHKYLQHFLRGYLDARSSLQLHNKKLSLVIVNSLNFLTNLKGILEKQSNIKITSKIIHNYTKTQFKMTILTNQAKNIINYLYRDATIYLPRKYDIVKHLLK